MQNRHALVSLAVLAVVALSAGRASSQEISDFDEPAEVTVRRYQVEVILFANTNIDPTEEDFDYEVEPSAPAPLSSLPDERRFPIGFDPNAFAADRESRADEAAAADTAAGTSSEPTVAAATDTASETADPNADPFELIDPFGDLGGAASAPTGPDAFEFRLLRPDEMQLNDAYARIDRLGAYRALAHVGWVQDGLDESHARAMSLATLGVANPRGTLTLFLERFLHFAVDLEYESPQPPGAGGGFETGVGADFGPGVEPGPTASAPTSTSELSELVLRPRFRMQVQRRARSGEVHYIDHPYFGLIFLITPAPDEEPIEDDTDVLAPAA